MRILGSFIAGAILWFYLSEIILRISRRFPILGRLLPLNHSLLGLFLILLGIIGGFISSSDPIQPVISFFLMGSGVGMIFHHLLSRQYVLFEGLEKNFVHKHETLVERILEILPGALMWVALTSPVWLSFTLPFAVAYLILLADIYWLINSLKIAVMIYLGYKKMVYARSQDWKTKLEKDFSHEYPQFYQLLVLPTYKESLAVLKPVFEAIANSDYPKKKIFLAVGFEAWADQNQVKEIIQHLQKYNKILGGVFTTIHELGEGEVKGPGTNRNCMVRNAVKEFEKLHLPIDQVFVTTLDADFVIHKQFLAGALYKYLSTPEGIRDKRTYTGSFFYYNNYWQTPTPMRLIAAGTAFWQLAEMAGSDKYMNFSSLSINMKSLLEIGLWIPDKVNDDSGFYWKAYYHFKGNYKVVPHYMPIYADAVLDTNLLKTLQNQYLQQKRWAYGVEHIPFIVRQYFTNNDLDFWDKTDKLFFAFWGYLKWGTLALFVSFAGLLIPLINPSYHQSVVAYNLPVVSSWILTMAFFGLFATIFVHEKTVPPRPKKWSLLQKIWSYIQWVIVPIVLVTISTLPAIEAQTTLMFGKYLEFRVTNKARTA